MPPAVLRFREKYPDVQLRLVEGLRHSTGPMVRDATLDMSLAPRAPQGQDDPAIRFKPIAHLSPIVQRLPGVTVGLHTRSDAPLARPAAALARVLSEIGRKVLQRPPAR